LSTTAAFIIFGVLMVSFLILCFGLRFRHTSLGAACGA
jgi:hypothetical protein